MKAYYYLLFWIYRYYKDKQNENEFEAIFSATSVSTVLVGFVLLFFHGLANYFNLLPMYPNKFYAIMFFIFIGLINYYFVVRKKKFLSFNFHKDRKGGIYIITFIIALSVSFIILANINREKIFKERRENPSIEQIERRPSLEGKIRKWFEETF